MDAAASLTAVALASEQEIFDGRISDHLPQEYRVTHPALPDGLEVFSWNAMARGLHKCRKGGNASSSNVEEPRCNNGLELDETIGEYRRRLREMVAPMIRKWIISRQRQRDRASHWVVCIQEAPGHPGESEELWNAISLGSASSLRRAMLKDTGFTQLVTIWDSTEWDLVLQAKAADGFALCTVFGWRQDPASGSLSDTTLRLINCHLPLTANEQDMQPAAAVAILLRETPVNQLALIVGDLNANLSKGLPEGSMLAAWVAGSAAYGCSRVTSDGAVLGVGEAPSDVCTETQLDAEAADPLGGLSRKEFICKNIHYRLQAQVLSAADLSDKDLGYLGAYHFADQATKLAELMQGHSMLQASGNKPLVDFGEEGREGFLRRHVHRKLQREAAVLTDQELLSLGHLHFSEQQSEFERLRSRSQHAACCAAPPECNEAATLRLIGGRRLTRGCSSVQGRTSTAATENCWDVAPRVASTPSWEHFESIDGACGQRVPALYSLLELAGLGMYSEAANEWCEQMGAISLEEVKENAADFAAHLGLPEPESHRLFAILLEDVAEVVQHRSRPGVTN